MGEFIQISFTDLQPEQRDILVAQLADAGFEGFEETENSLEAFISQPVYNRSLLEEITFKYQITFKETKVKNINWNQIWESSFQPVQVENFVGIRADFHPANKVVEHEIIITPKMSFGTGHHATTFMMIEQMRELDFKGKKVFDFGTGTGILAILSEKLGAAKVIAVDNDAWSIKNAKENFKKNGCHKINIKKVSDAGAGEKFEIILANINRNVILDNLSALKNQLTETGILLISGILEEDKAEILEAASQQKFHLINELIKNNWLCLKFHS